MRNTTIILLLSLICNGIFAQKLIIADEYNSCQSKILTVKILDNITKNADGAYGYKLKMPMDFTSFAVGWQAATHNYYAGLFDVKVKVHKPRMGWTKWNMHEGYISPQDNKDNIYKTDLLFGYDEYTHDSIEFYIYPPENEVVTEIYLILLDISQYFEQKKTDVINSSEEKDLPTTQNAVRADCPAFPAGIIKRSSWCSSGVTKCLNPIYSVQNRPNMTHAVIHHGASPSTYTDGAAVVRSYWDYHVNSNGWDDIGYNYLVDKYGNLYQGRHNTTLETSAYVDVHGAHAGNANTYSIGVNFLGDSDAAGTAPTTPQIEKCAQLLAWWFARKGINPTSYASILKQTGSYSVSSDWLNLPRICGHKDVHPGGTTCPGNTLYNLLATIRTKTAQNIQACLQNPATNIVARDWNNGNFNAVFEDEASNTAFWQVIDTKGYRNNSFFLDSLKTNQYWTAGSTGNWAFGNDGVSANTGSGVINTVITAPIVQPSGKILLYQWKMRFNNTGTNTRAGIHFLCNNPADPNISSYMFYLRETYNTAQIYKYNSSGGYNSSTEFKEVTTTVNAGVWYDMKIVFNPTAKTIDIYKDNLLILSYTDAAPYTSGSYVVLKASDCEVSYKDFAVYTNRTTTEQVTVFGSSAYIQQQSDNNQTPAGKINTLLLSSGNIWSALYSKNIFVDSVPPTTNFETSTNWQSDGFMLNFEDKDELSGVNQKFYQVLDFDGTNSQSNSNFGYFYDNFSKNSIGSIWTVPSPTSTNGTWSINSGSLKQENTGLTNTNIYANVKQSQTNTYLYNFKMKLSGTGTNKRAGIFFFCDDPSATFRGNAYMVYFRSQTGATQCEVYKAGNGTISDPEIINAPIANPENWCDYKIVYSPVTGEMSIYQNNVFILQWTDPSPLTAGNSVSLRSGGCIAEFDDINVYKSRSSAEIITVGTNAEINPANQGIVNTVLIDNAKNWSNTYSKDIFVDKVPPVTNILNTEIWYTENFTANFDDTDLLSGVDKKFYQVLDFDNNLWRANTNFGFFNDDFSTTTPHIDWKLGAVTATAGNWAITDGYLRQSSETTNLSKYYTKVTQTSNNTYLYHWKMRQAGTGSNKRSGIYFFASDPAQTYCGNAYMIYFRVDDHSCEIYKVENNIIGEPAKDAPISINPNVWYDCKVIYNPTTGEITAYQDDVPVLQWIDPQPHQNGNYISLRTGNAITDYDDIKIYKLRGSSVNVTVGQETEIRYQNPNPTTPSAKITAFSIDNAGNFSDMVSKNLNIDRTPPTVGNISVSPNEIETDYAISANYTAEDVNSGVVKYYYSVGTGAGNSDIVNWTQTQDNDITFQTSYQFIANTNYYFNLKAENAAGLISEVVSKVFFIVEKLEIISRTPTINAENVALDAEVSVLFNQNITPANLNNITVNSNTVTASVSGGKLIINHNTFAYETSYTVNVPVGTIDGYNEVIEWTFTTLDNPTEPVAVLSTTPENGAENVALDAEVSVLFNQNITPANLNNITVNSNTVTASVLEDKLIIEYGSFAYGTTYTVTVPVGAISDYDAVIEWTFKTKVETGIPVVNETGINIYLTNGEVNIIVSAQSSVRVFDVSGRIIGIYSAYADVPLKFKQPAGVYMVEVAGNGEVNVYKLVVK